MLESEVMALLSEEAVDYPTETFGQIVRRVLGPEGFSQVPNGEAFEHKCRAAFEAHMEKVAL
jgi:hypothetical protein